MTRATKLYAGAQLRETRLRNALTQKDFAARLGVSLSYLNQMETNSRPIAPAVILALAREFAFDVTRLSVGEADRLVADMREALADPVFGGAPPLAELQLVASNAPGIARAFLTLHRAHRQGQERLASLDEALGRGSPAMAPLPWEEVRDFFHYCDNYIDAVDRAAEHFAEGSGLAGPDKLSAGARWLEGRGISVTLTGAGPLRLYEPAARRLSLSAASGPASQAFQMAHQVALLFHAELLDATLDLARFRTEEARSICRIGLANYFAGAATLPYRRFLEAAQEVRHDIELLAARFSASLEQIGHRLSTLQRPGAKGVPFFFVRVDPAGTITKRHSATRLQFARFGGACPLWNVHRAFESPGTILRQLAETPDGVRYLCLACDVSKPGGRFRAPVRRFAIGLGCEIAHAPALVYADDLDIGSAAAFEPIGVSCRICERAACHQRAVPPVEKALVLDPNRREVLPYGLA